MKLIALSGRARSGKNTVATIIRLADSWEHSDYFKLRYPDKRHFILSSLTLHSDVALSCSTYKEAAFADLLKYTTALIFNIEDPKYLWDELFKNSENSLRLADKDGHVFTYREILQRLGTEVGRAIHPNLWINALFNSLNKDSKYIITDVRFTNEAEACLENNATLIRIERASDQMNHSSETSLDNYEHFDHVIDNNGTLEELIDKILQLNII